MSIHDDSTLPPFPQAPADRVNERTVARVVLAVVIVCVVIACLAACDSRYLTKEQDEAMRAQCAEVGCRVVPLPVWREIQNFFQQLQQHQTEQG